MSKDNEEILDTVVQDDVSTDSDNNDTLNNEDTALADKAENQKIRAEKAEAKLKELKEALKDKEDKPSDKKDDNKPILQTGLSRDEAILFAKGLTEEEVDKASKIAQIEGISLTEATQSEFFEAWKESNEKKAKSEKAQLGTSKGSPKVKEKKDFNSSDVSRDEHKAMFDQRNK